MPEDVDILGDKGFIGINDLSSHKTFIPRLPCSYFRTTLMDEKLKFNKYYTGLLTKFSPLQKVVFLKNS